MDRTVLALLCLSCLSSIDAGAHEAIWLEGEAGAPTVNPGGFTQAASLGSVERDLFSPGTPGGANGDALVYSATGTTGQAQWSFNLVEGGTYTFWIRVSAHVSVLRYAFDGAALTSLSLDDPRESVFCAVPWSENFFAEVDWVKAGTASLGVGAHTLTLAIDPNSNFSNDAYTVLDAMALVNFPWAPSGAVLPPNASTPTPAKDAWYPFLPDDDLFSPQSITDMSALVPAPAGALGHVTRVGDHFELEDAPGIPIKFWGADALMAGTPALQDQQAQLYRKNGINIVRFQWIESFLGPLQKNGSGRFLDPTLLDQLDHWFATLKSHGIYMTWSSFSFGHAITPDDGYPSALFNELPADDVAGVSARSSLGLVNFMPALQDAEWQWLSTLLLHTNPYTGMRYIDDPALAIVETHNEDDLYWYWPLSELANPSTTQLPQHRIQFQLMWMNWVQAKYVTTIALQAAWGASFQAGDSVTNPSMAVYNPFYLGLNGPDPRMGDFIHFLTDAQKGYYTAREAALRSLGYLGVTVTSAWLVANQVTDAALIYADDSATAIDRHGYSGGGSGAPSSGYMITVENVDNTTQLATPGAGILGAGLSQVEDKPFIMTEWAEATPNQWKAEMSPLFAFYGMGLQGWDASHLFTGGFPRMAGGWPDLRPWVLETPLYLGQFPALSFAIAKHHITEGAIAAGRRFAPTDIFQATDVFQGPDGGYLPNEVLAIGRVTAKIGEGLDASTQIDWSPYWDQAQQVLRSTTGELVWDYGHRVVMVQAAKTQAVIGFAGGLTLDLPGASVDVVTPFVSLIFTPLDDVPLIDSSHILITALARDQQTGATYSADGGMLTAVGGPPLLLEPVQASITFKGGPIETARVVDQYGVPTTQDIERTGNTVQIDGRYSSYYYEITRAAVADAGTDAGVNSDGGGTPTADGGSPGPPPHKAGCGCGVAPTESLGLLFMGLFLLQLGRRRSSHEAFR